MRSLNVISLFFALNLALILVSCENRSVRTDRWTNANSDLEISLEVFKQYNGYRYVFKSKSVKSDSYVDALSFVHDNNIPVRPEQVTFLGRNHAFIYMGWKLAVTGDGKAWKVWDGSRDLSDWECCNYALIDKVVIHENGEGEMSLKEHSGDQTEMRGLYTCDFGTSWQTSAETCDN